LTDLLQNIARSAVSIFEVEDDMIDSGASEFAEKIDHEVAAGSEAEVDWSRGLGRRVGQIDTERLGEGLEDARRDRFHHRAPLRNQFGLPREIARIGDPAICMLGDPLEALAARTGDQYWQTGKRFGQRSAVPIKAP
jgi:hypothetical protein